MRIQQVRKVRRQRRPGYPTRPEVARDPELLRRHVPPAWKKSAQVTAALSIMLAAAHAQDADSQKSSLKIAPIFVHGEGYGSDGCIVLNPPRFLAEDAARTIIMEELARAGIPTPVQDITLPCVFVQKVRDERLDKGWQPLKFDFWEPTKRIAIEYVSYKDENLLLSGDTTWLGGSVTPRNFLKASQWVREEILGNDRAPDVYYGILYDPAPAPEEPESTSIPAVPEKSQKSEEVVKVSPSEPQRRLPRNVGSAWLNSPEGREKMQKRNDESRKAHDEALRKAYEKSSALLRAQVRDFIEWLKGQGAI